MARDFGSGPSNTMIVTFTGLSVAVALLMLITYVSELFDSHTKGSGGTSIRKAPRAHICTLGTQINYNDDSLCTNKTNISQVNNLVQFEDGSWCDFLNGRCENNGPGDLILNSIIYKGK